jgi:hypothetical protein
MTTRAPKSETEDPRTVDVRPGEVVVISDRRVIVGDRALNASYSMENQGWAIEVDVPTILPQRIFMQRDGDARKLERDGTLAITDQQRGVMADVIDVSDSYWTAAWRDGVRPSMNRQQLIDSWQGTVVDRSLAEVIVNCLDAGIPEDAAVGILVRTYDQSFVEQTASERPWILASQRLIEEHLSQNGHANGDAPDG